ncbi:hypothetical protein BDV97DRAFT_40787 [Delphinella strobiligena]|nr:hypothetical protein BDV97DRAFT_40787 [Delphinella strobiligena]
MVSSWGVSNTLCCLMLLVPWISDMPVAQQLNPIRNMCTRYSHQSVVKGDTLYIDGGLEVFKDLVNGSLYGNTTLGYNEYLIEIDLSQPWDWQTKITEKALRKSANPDTMTMPPSLANGAMYRGLENDPNIYIYGGTTSYQNVSFPGFVRPMPETYSLWSYHTGTSRWDQYDITSGSPWRPSNGAYTEAPDQGLSFYFNGELDSGSSPKTQPIGDHVKIFLEGMIVIDTRSKTATNLSTSLVSSDQPRTRGSLSYISAIGNNGILVAFGGTYKPVDDLDSEETANFLDMSEVCVFDIESYYDNSSTWYTQNATGDIPASRAQFCSVVVSAADNSSHNIYIYGGLGQSNQYFDDIYVLSIPSFTWTKVYGPGESPRFSHTCHLVGNRQMLTIGGILGSSNACDWETKGVGVLDLSTITWGSVYTPHNGTYQVPDKVLATIGGSPNGNASLVQPSAEFSDAGIAGLFGFKWTDQTAAAIAESQRIRTIEGVAISVGSVAILLFIAVAVWFWLRKRGPRAKSYTIGIICALPREKAAVMAMLEREYAWPYQVATGDTNAYSLSRIGSHNVVVACLPAGKTGKAPAAVVATNMQRSFRSIEIGLMVGIAGGIWSKHDDVRLGDVVVSEPTGIHGGVVQTDFGKMETQGFRRTGNLNMPAAKLLTALNALKARHLTHDNHLAEHLSKVRDGKTNMSKASVRPRNDELFQADYTHEIGTTCKDCDTSRLVRRSRRADSNPHIHYGNISSADHVVKDARHRDRLGRDENVIAVEMEAAGLMDNFPCVIIRGICDYADSHKNDDWQDYAAMVAAAYAKELLLSMSRARVRGSEVMATPEEQAKQPKKWGSRLCNRFHNIGNVGRLSSKVI